MPSDGGGKAREWTLRAFYNGGRTIVAGPSIGAGLEVEVVEKEWADRQLAEALDVIEGIEAASSGRFGAPDLLRKHGRPR